MGQRGDRHLRADRHDSGDGATPPAWVPASGALYITAHYWFTSSNSFANPAITVARSLSDTFAGIAPYDAPMFIVAQLVGAALGAVAGKALFD